MVVGLMFAIVGLKMLGVVIVVVYLGWLGGYNTKKNGNKLAMDIEMMTNVQFHQKITIGLRNGNKIADEFKNIKK
jgi:hypothetical protein